MADSQSAGAAQIKVWDPLVRIGHWLLVLLFAVAYITEGEPLFIHTWAGYGVAAYVVLRVLWGLFGSKHARFSDFAYGPRAALGYLKELIRFQAKRHIGHSPAGGAMVFALLLSLACTTGTGTALLAVKENAGPLAPLLGSAAPASQSMETDDDDEDGDDRESGERREHKGGALEEVHEILANLTLVLVILHIGGVVLASVVHKENLARSMVTGKKRED
jgi:cytochrome b